jgi:small conductance mechanosensitive channel
VRERPLAPAEHGRRQPPRRPAAYRRTRFVRGRRGDPRLLRAEARARLRHFRRGSIVAVALVGLLLIVWGEDAPADMPLAGVQPAAVAQAPPPAPPDQVLPAGNDELPEPAPLPETEGPPADPATAVYEATRTIGDLLRASYGFLPKLVIAIVILLLAAVVSRMVRVVLRRVLRNWSRAEAISALAGVIIFLVALGAALSVLAGDARALVGSIGLAGLALSWALQTPIESFTGWLLNSFQSYYRVGDRIAVGDVFGDVYKIDILTTTVWEAGGPGKAVQGAQPTGALITFPNLEVLRSNIVNYTREFSFVWDEVTFGVANESDLPYAVRVLESVARRVVGPQMAEPVTRYRDLLERRGLAFDVLPEPKVFASLSESWTNLTVRYLVHARQRRLWASELTVAVAQEFGLPEHSGRIIPSYPRAQVQWLGPEQNQPSSSEP